MHFTGYVQEISVAIIGVWAFAALILVLFQRRFMYHPDRYLALPEQYGLTSIEARLVETADQLRLRCWVHRPRAGRPTIVYFHGNAGHLGNRAPLFQALSNAGFGLVAVSYRGFGDSPGTPTETGLYEDARATLRYACQLTGATADALIYFGESLGTGVAVELARTQPPALLVLEAAYSSVRQRSVELYPFVPFAEYLVRDRYDSLAKIAEVRAPILMLHGEADALIPLAHGKTLFAAANEPKELLIYPGIHHNDFPAELVVQAVEHGYANRGVKK